MAPKKTDCEKCGDDIEQLKLDVSANKARLDQGAESFKLLREIHTEVVGDRDNLGLRQTARDHEARLLTIEKWLAQFGKAIIWAIGVVVSVILIAITSGVIGALTWGFRAKITGDESLPKVPRIEAPAGQSSASSGEHCTKCGKFVDRNGYCTGCRAYTVGKIE